MEILYTKNRFKQATTIHDFLDNAMRVTLGSNFIHTWLTIYSLKLARLDGRIKSHTKLETDNNNLQSPQRKVILKKRLETYTVGSITTLLI